MDYGLRTHGSSTDHVSMKYMCVECEVCARRTSTRIGVFPFRSPLRRRSPSDPDAHIHNIPEREPSSHIRRWHQPASPTALADEPADWRGRRVEHEQLLPLAQAEAEIAEIRAQIAEIAGIVVVERERAHRRVLVRRAHLSSRTLDPLGILVVFRWHVLRWCRCERRCGRLGGLDPRRKHHAEGGLGGGDAPRLALC